MMEWVQANDWVLRLIFWVPMIGVVTIIGAAALPMIRAWRRGEPLPRRSLSGRKPGRMRKRMKRTFGGR